MFITRFINHFVLEKHEVITNADVREMFVVSSATANRILAKMTEEGRLLKIRLGDGENISPLGSTMRKEVRFFKFFMENEPL